MIKQQVINDNIPLNSENNNNSNSSLFEARKFYYDRTLKFVTDDILKEVVGKTTLRQIPFGNVYENNALFGVVDYDGDIVLPIVNNSNFTIVGTNQDKTLRLQNFVADAFSDMKEYLNRQVIKNAFSNTSAYFNVTIKKAFDNVDELYPASNIITANKFKNFVIGDRVLDSKITDHKTFNKEYIKFLVDHLQIIPVTKSSFAKDINFDIFSSGLIFTIAEDDNGDDVNKYIKYYLDEGFICFAEACERFGFKFDKNIPFVLFADINSPAMKPYLNRYGIENGEDVFKKRFKKLFLEDVDQLKLLFYNSYNTFLIENSYYGEDYSKVCALNASKTIFKERATISFQEYVSSFSETYWYRLYLYFKNLELNRGMTQIQFDTLNKVIGSYVNLKKTKKALEIINKKFNESSGVKYFDSLQNNKKMLEQNEQVGVTDRPIIIFEV